MRGWVGRQRSTTTGRGAGVPSSGWWCSSRRSVTCRAWRWLWNHSSGATRSRSMLPRVPVLAGLARWRACRHRCASRPAEGRSRHPPIHSRQTRCGRGSPHRTRPPLRSQRARRAHRDRCVSSSAAIRSRSPRILPVEQKGWRSFSIAATRISGVSCPTDRSCVASGADGMVSVSSDPAGGPEAWDTVAVP
jgi:hypothetical protein